MEMETETIAPSDPENYANDTNQNWKKKNLEDRLLNALSKLSTMPSSCNAKWWYSTFHNVTATVGAGVLGLPNALSKLTWVPGITVLVISWIITLYTQWQMVEMHEAVPGKRFDRYHELGQHAFGDKLGLWVVVPQQLVVEVGVDIVYMVTGAKSLREFYYSVCPDHKDIELTYFIMIFASVHFILAQLPNLKSISGVSLAAAIMSLSYRTVAWGVTVHKGRNDHVEYKFPEKSTNATVVFDFFGSLGHVAFAYAGHNVLLEIQATIPSTPEKPSKKPMWKGTMVAYFVVAFCYFPVAVLGYWAFGNSVDHNILETIGDRRWRAAANMMVVIHHIGGYQLYAMPVFDLMETVLIKKLEFPEGMTLRLVARTYYVAFTMFMAITFPFFGRILGFIGGFALAPTTYFLPYLIWLEINKPRKFSLSWFTNWVCIVFGVLVMIIAPIGGLREIIVDAPTYKLYL